MFCLIVFVFYIFFKLILNPSLRHCEKTFFILTTQKFMQVIFLVQESKHGPLWKEYLVVRCYTSMNVVQHFDFSPLISLFIHLSFNNIHIQNFHQIFRYIKTQWGILCYIILLSKWSLNIWLYYTYSYILMNWTSICVPDFLRIDTN